ncbi:TylF/MycF/NovP-related O-methyltransferase [Maridesulfovibrio sp. FT414]|uniref:TylF/MycF/NovP-related O-methyltransferase n=1 Tax=Maridesulfovibrio sp. FT414 TaxID=2979469 RepID=UPI003D80222B
MTKNLTQLIGYLKKNGYTVRKHRTSPDNSHQTIYPAATYSPWSLERRFIETYEKIKPMTCVDIYRLYSLWNLTGQVKNLPGNILEVGVWKGGSGILMATQAKLTNQDTTTYLCDTFSGIVKNSIRDNFHQNGDFNDTSAKQVKSALIANDLDRVAVLQGIFPEQTCELVSAPLKLAHIDVDVYDSARDAFAWIWPRLVCSGVVVFDDYGFASCKGVTQFVNEIAGRNDATFIYNLTGQAILIKR